MRIALVGCGNVAPFYLRTLHVHPELELAGVMDWDDERSRLFSTYYSTHRYGSLEELLGDRSVELVVNLTSVTSHFSVSRASLEAGKHVYSEKPMALSLAEAKELVHLAERKGLCISSAPSRVLAETAQTMWKALRNEAIGTVRLAYAEMDGGLVFSMPYGRWKNELGIPWPYQGEFEVGCTIEHAAYAVTWLMAFFGPIQSITAFSSCQVPDKGTDVPLGASTPDFSAACLTFSSGVVARLTSSWIAPSDHSIRIFGDRGILSTDDVWKPRAPVYIRRNVTFGRKTILSPWRKRYPFSRPPSTRNGRAVWFGARDPGALIRSTIRRIRGRLVHVKKRVDFCLGIAEAAASIREGRSSRLSASYCLHANEAVLAIHNALRTGAPYRMTTSFDPVEPMPWAKA